MKRTLYRFASVLMLGSLAVACSKDELASPSTSQPSTAAQSPDATATRGSHLALGNPSGATTSTTNYTNYLMSK